MSRDTPIERMPVVVLAGGMGTRLREETERVPKPLVEIGEHPILWHILKLYGHHGARRFLVCLGYKSWAIKEFFLRYHEQGADLTVHLGSEEPPTFHGSAVAEDWEVTLAETFMFTYGDGIGRVDIEALVDFHRSHDRIATVTGVHPSSRYGEMRVEDAVATEFNEKPTTPEGFVSGGFFVFQREIFDYLTEEPALVLEQAPLRRLARDGQLAVYRHEDFWMGMDTYREFEELNRLWEAGEAPWKVWGAE